MATRLAAVETVLKALADGTRLRILTLLTGGEICVCDIHDTLKLSQPTVSRHLAYLRRSGLVDARREGKWMHYRLAEVDDSVLRTLREIVTHALTHVDVVAKDAARLKDRTGCCVATGTGTDLPCCSAVGASHAHQDRAGHRA